MESAFERDEGQESGGETRQSIIQRAETKAFESPS